MKYNLNNERQMRALTGLDKEKFLRLVETFEKEFEEERKRAYEEGKKEGRRQRKSGGGRKGKLPTMRDKLFFVLVYLKSYPTFDVLGGIFNMSRQKACENIHKLLPIVYKTLMKMGVMPDREFNSPEELKEAMEDVEKILLDATERPHQRPKDAEKQKEMYSGKKKAHTGKNTILGTKEKVVIYVGGTVSGKNHDYGTFKKEFPVEESWLEGQKVMGDSGYQGMDKDYKEGEVEIPKKRPRKSKKNPKPELTKEEKESNREQSRERIKIEHAIGGIKRYHILINKFRNRIDGMFDNVMAICTGLWNFFLFEQGNVMV